MPEITNHKQSGVTADKSHHRILQQRQSQDSTLQRTNQKTECITVDQSQDRMIQQQTNHITASFNNRPITRQYTFETGQLHNTKISKIDDVCVCVVCVFTFPECKMRP